jgi:hypothetical protein
MQLVTFRKFIFHLSCNSDNQGQSATGPGLDQPEAVATEVTASRNEEFEAEEKLAS